MQFVKFALNRFVLWKSDPEKSALERLVSERSVFTKSHSINADLYRLDFFRQRPEKMQLFILHSSMEKSIIGVSHFVKSIPRILQPLNRPPMICVLGILDKEKLQLKNEQPSKRVDSKSVYEKLQFRNSQSKNRLLAIF